jgi:glycosyltransferase involved in cell wall biosynthesis
MKPDLSIIIPAYNESDRIAGPLRTIIEYLRTQPFTAEVIVVSDGSSDDTMSAADAVFSEYPDLSGRSVGYEKNRGKGYAVKTGMLAAEADIVLFSDADLSTPIEELHKLVDPIKSGEFDVTFGSRALDRSLIGTHQPWRREQGGKVFNLVVRLMTGMPYWDTQCGFKAFSMPRFRPLLDVMQIERFGFDVEFLYVARLHGLRLQEIPVRWNNDDRSKVNVLRDSVRMFDEVRQIRRNAKAGVYNTT